jgi:ArsR family transcriptional regulator
MIVELSNYAKIFKALSNKQRLNIFMMIYKNCCGLEGELPLDSKSCCGVKGSIESAFSKVCDCMDLSRSTISHHFKELQNAGLIICEREGQAFRCSVNEETVNAIKNFLK